MKTPTTATSLRRRVDEMRLHRIRHAVHGVLAGRMEVELRERPRLLAAHTAERQPASCVICTVCPLLVIDRRDLPAEHEVRQVLRLHSR
jgi:hypothetical protein